MAYASEQKIPPQSLEAEQSVLGSMMLEPTALEKGLDILQTEDFYRPAHQAIFFALAELARRNEPVDLITVQEELRSTGKLDDSGGTEYLMTLADSVPTAANVEYYARIVERKAILRNLIATGTEIISAAYEEENEDIDLVLAQAEESILKVGQRRCGSRGRFMPDVYQELYYKLDQLPQQYSIPIGMKSLAYHCIGLGRKELIVIGARPRIGKSAFAMQLLQHAAAHGFPAAIISCEMTEEQFALRELAKHSGVHLKQIFTGNIQDVHVSRIANAVGKLVRYPVYFEQANGWDMRRIASACRRLVSAGVKVIAIDHMQVIEPKNPRAPRREQLGQISRDCKTLAVNLDVPIIALSQLSRRVDDRADSVPGLADLKESGDIEANADVVMMLWRPLNDENDRTLGQTDAKINIAKARMLPPAMVTCKFEGRRFQFIDVTEDYGDPGATQQTLNTQEGED